MNEEKLKQIEEYAGKLMTIEEIAVLIDEDVEVMKDGIHNNKSDIYRAYKKGKSERKLTIMNNIIKYAEAGSPQAELLYEKFSGIQDLGEME